MNVLIDSLKKFDLNSFIRNISLLYFVTATQIISLVHLKDLESRLSVQSEKYQQELSTLEQIHNEKLTAVKRSYTQQIDDLHSEIGKHSSPSSPHPFHPSQCVIPYLHHISLKQT